LNSPDGFFVTNITTADNATGAGAVYNGPWTVTSYLQGVTVDGVNTNQYILTKGGLWKIDYGLSFSGMDSTSTFCNIRLINAGDGWTQVIQAFNPAPLILPASGGELVIASTYSIVLPAGQSLGLNISIIGMGGNTVDILFGPTITSYFSGHLIAEI
jgi:hypothetical protein